MSNIPSTWEILKFKKVCKIVEGQVDPNIEPYCNMKHIGPGNIEKFTGHFSNVRTAKEDGQTSGKYLFNAKHVIYGKINPHFAKACYPQFEGVCSADAYPIECVKDKLVPKFLLYSILDERFTSYTVSVSGRTGMPKINRADLELYDFNVPPVDEQKKIAEILTSVDKVIELTEIEIEKLKNLKKGMMQDLLTKGIGHTKFKESPIGKIPIGWETVKLKEVCDIKHGYAFEGEYFRNDPKEYILLTPGNFHVDGHLYFGSNTKFYEGPIPDGYILENGDLLCVMTDLTKDMAILGNAIILENSRKVLHNQRIGKFLIKNDRITKDYLALQLNYEFVQKVVKDTSTGTTVRHTSPSKILSCHIPIPSDLKEQELIVKAIESVQKNIELRWEKLSKHKDTKKGLMQDLLTGKVRVKV